MEAVINLATLTAARFRGLTRRGNLGLHSGRLIPPERSGHKHAHPHLVIEILGVLAACDGLRESRRGLEENDEGAGTNEGPVVRGF